MPLSQNADPLVFCNAGWDCRDKQHCWYPRAVKDDAAKYIDRENGMVDGNCRSCHFGIGCGRMYLYAAGGEAKPAEY